MQLSSAQHLLQQPSYCCDELAVVVQVLGALEQLGSNQQDDHPADSKQQPHFM